MNNDNTVFVVHPLNPPPEPWIDFGYMYPSTAFAKFVRDFQFTGTRGLKELTPANLETMYQAGKVEIYCSLVVKIIYHGLYFRLTKNNTMIVRDDNDNEHEVGEVFRSPIQFMEYTQNHWLLTEG